MTSNLYLQLEVTREKNHPLSTFKRGDSQDLGGPNKTGLPTHFSPS